MDKCSSTQAGRQCGGAGRGLLLQLVSVASTCEGSKHKHKPINTHTHTHSKHSLIHSTAALVRCTRMSHCRTARELLHLTRDTSIIWGSFCPTLPCLAPSPLVTLVLAVELNVGRGHEWQRLDLTWLWRVAALCIPPAALPLPSLLFILPPRCLPRCACCLQVVLGQLFI